MLRSIREALRGLIAAANNLKSQQTDLLNLVAYATVLDDLQGQFDRVGRKLSKLERSPIATA